MTVLPSEPVVIPAPCTAANPGQQPRLPVEVELAASYIQREFEPPQMVAVSGPLHCTGPYQTFTVEGPLLIISFAGQYDPNLTLPRPLSTDNHDRTNPNRR